LVLLHASVFSVGVVTLLVGLAIKLPGLLLLAGPCLSVSGILIWVGSRITFAGPLGDVLRLALGRTRVITIHLRALMWLLIGIVVTVYAVDRMRASDSEPPLRDQPLAPRME
jgi:hypothetical protein